MAGLYLVKKDDGPGVALHLHMKKTKKIMRSRNRLPDRSSELLINHRILYAVRDELKSDILSINKRFDSLELKIDSINARVDSLELKIDSINARVDSLELKIGSLAAQMEAHAANVNADVKRMVALYEEQNHQNKTALEAYQQVYNLRRRR